MENVVTKADGGIHLTRTSAPMIVTIVLSYAWAINRSKQNSK